MDIIIQKTQTFVQETLKNAEKGHDYDHVERVWKYSLKIAQLEEQKNTQQKINFLVLQLAALLHDIADYKFHAGNEDIGPQTASDFLKNTGLVDQGTIDQVTHIIINISFKGAQVQNTMKSLEGLIVQDADRLDALGAVGIARCFAYGGFKNRALYDPQIQPVLHNSSDAYKKNQSPSLNHFYEKLFHLKDQMNTQSGKELAEKRHDFMVEFVNRFKQEWEGNQ
ncbi:metal dependent phosphohydrolase, putative [Ichthyophthirius multifiliis]|uniref:Metal dependent phosphohydrolase, putative n=1 Tax=Ichthyophthirius multifiliis TaxID=5932 RepID=G0R4E4_ICHMU|nr:metal dependent phosphohydrolase, putative [Ichthyophthirius multifiliis]EGR27663.1 metal dependent phosphohydrolase, putative [Ichthyophthirius multifiliis]|eukprot:XP_004025115.1 metal dependent phosphohydrolase, putative [Ichthyophthirius multifiliis]